MIKKYIRIIDFGTSEIVISTKSIPLYILHTPFISYNSPFSRILFSDRLIQALKLFLTKYKINQSSPQLHEKTL